MGFIIEKQLTNARPPKANVAELVTTPTKGNMRISELAAERLGLKAGSYIGVVSAKLEEGGESKIFVFKGWEDKENGHQGSKLASPNNKQGGTLLFSSAYAYQSLEGNSEFNRHFKLADAGVEQDGVMYFELTWEKDTAKAERVYADDDDNAEQVPA